ncbi:MAG: biotin--[acetyl-CoA-carboxylase] ligase [Bacteroidetes bacterium]|nr:biotin--[acetyl-CoA-carboxylase] ligase [Rhodothermia bacterium]MCS7154611.1 biotin--[acetyl-CoA-carboxylase] ligase [Bacteroidota bacterium]MCX7906328.1 biotin--[acetyl-CoA-carboxylase] ligase [Bacteroidota bacterium]MDW8137404.1 biotin--[acetyl-CoA-carboxylase] ligase [Bacteroidota bacterium]MDW8285642.1 biotin--[acetyl-CoA-carboxylase] ligase [Bacteroidota bacterium]
MSIQLMTDKNAQPLANWQPARFEACLRTRLLGRVARYEPEVDSTNTLLQAWAKAGAPTGALVVADYQRAGRGRWGRSWLSSPAQNLLVSVLLEPAPVAAGWQALACAVALAEVLAEWAPGCGVQLKWPNDVWLNGRKVAGILIESAAERLVVGVGLNVNEGLFPAALAERATSLRREIGRLVEREPLLAAILERLEAWWEILQEGRIDSLQAAYEARMLFRGSWVPLRWPPEAAPRQVLLLGLAPDGGLRIRTQAGQEACVYAAEVSIGGELHVADRGYR